MTPLFLAACATLALASPPSTPLLSASLSRVSLRVEIPLQAPAGWKREEKDGTTVLTPADVAEGTSYAVLVTPGEGKASSLEEILEGGKKKVAEIGAFKPATEPRLAKSDGGWDYLLVLGMLETKDRTWLAQVTAVKKGDDGGVVIVLSESVETMTKYADALGAMMRGMGGGAAQPGDAAVGAADLRYTVPPGWTEAKVNGYPSLVKEKNEVWTKYRISLLVLATEPRAGTVREQFEGYWKAFVAPNYATTVVPMPLIARLDSGYACAFDADSGAKDKNGTVTTVVLFMLAHGGRVTPVLGIYAGTDWQADRASEAETGLFLESARIPGASAEKVALFAADQLAGDWSESSAEYASYVTPGGAYAGDASVATASYLHLVADGSYSRTLIAISGGRHIKEKDEGTWTVDDDALVLSKGGRYSLLGYGVDAKAGRFLVIGNYSNTKARLKFTNPRGILQAMWLKAR